MSTFRQNTVSLSGGDLYEFELRGPQVSTVRLLLTRLMAYDLAVWSTITLRKRGVQRAA